MDLGTDSEPGINPHQIHTSASHRTETSGRKNRSSHQSTFWQDRTFIPTQPEWANEPLILHRWKLKPGTEPPQINQTTGWKMQASDKTTGNFIGPPFDSKKALSFCRTKTDQWPLHSPQMRIKPGAEGSQYHSTANHKTHTLSSKQGNFTQLPQGGKEVSTLPSDINRQMNPQQHIEQRQSLRWKPPKAITSWTGGHKHPTANETIWQEHTWRHTTLLTPCTIPKGQWALHHQWEKAKGKCKIFSALCDSRSKSVTFRQKISNSTKPPLSWTPCQFQCTALTSHPPLLEKSWNQACKAYRTKQCNKLQNSHQKKKGITPLWTTHGALTHNWSVLVGIGSLHTAQAISKPSPQPTMPMIPENFTKSNFPHFLILLSLSHLQKEFQH